MAGTGGSNDLNLLLKAKVVKLKVELDAKGSKLPSQVNGISKMLEDKPVKLKVKLHATIGELNSQISQISTMIAGAKSFKPIKIEVSLDMKNSVSTIKKQLKEAYDVIADFNKKYAKQIADMQKYMQQPPTPKTPKGTQVPTGAGVGGFNVKLYTKAIEDAEKQMRQAFDKKGTGLFSVKELKDAEGNLQGFITKIQKANGVIHEMRHSFDKDKGMFQVVDQSTMTATEAHIHKAKQSLMELQREIEKTGKSSATFNQEYAKLMARAGQGTLTQDSVKDFARRIKDEQYLIQQIGKENGALREQQNLISQIERLRSKTMDANRTSQLTNLKSQVKGLTSSDLADPRTKDILAGFRQEYVKINAEQKEAVKQEKDLINAEQKRLDVLNKITALQRTYNVRDKSNPLHNDNLNDIKNMAKQIQSMKDYIEVKKRMNIVDREVKQKKVDNQIVRDLDTLQKAMKKFGEMSGISANAIEARFQAIKRNVGTNLEQIVNETRKWNKKIQEEMDKTFQTRRNNSVVGGTNSRNIHADIKGFITNKDIQGLKDYISQLEKAKVATLALKTDRNGLTSITAQFESTGKTARKLTYEVDNVGKALRQVGQADVFNRNANLGLLEQLKIALQRVPTWFLSTTAFYGTIHAFQNMATEILNVDKAMTELKRVASDNLNIDTVFQGAVQLSQELGNNIHDIMNAVNDLARTYGNFNERQLLAVAKTAVLMSNVSDLSAEEATSTLVGTMNAFNIVAEDSIRIVDSLNEVDNDYAISTKQLAEGLSKSASTSKTFGVTLEENVGHITAIGAVTMESGAIIGNSLKTIYSRITTIAGAKAVLEGVGIGLYQIGEAGQKEIKPVSKILGDLAEKWGGLEKEQQQNIAVQVAGRYQLSRFLAMMNNWQMGVDATRTALSAQGSAMRENARYMESFEARINKLKNAFTEMSLSVGESFLSGAILTLVEGLASLAKMAIKVTDTVGALPVIFAVIGIVMYNMRMFDGAILRTMYTLEALKAKFIQTSGGATTFSGVMRGSMAVLSTSVTMASGAIARGFAVIKTAFRGLVASTIVGALFVGIGMGIEYLINLFDKQKRASERVEKANKQLIDSYRNTAGGLDSLIQKQEELQAKVDNRSIKDGTDAYNEYVKVTNELAQKMPTAVKYIDQSGLAHLRETKVIQAQLKYAKELSDLKHEETKRKFTENLGKNLDDYKKEQQSVESLRLSIKKLKKDLKTGTTTKMIGKNVVYANTDEKSTKEDIQKAQVEIVNHEQKKQQYIQKTMLLVQDTTMAYLESDKKLKNLTDSGKKVIENMVQANEGFLRYVNGIGGKEMTNMDEIDKRAVKLRKLGTDLGRFMSDTYENMTKGVEDPMKLQEIKSDVDNLVKSLPSTFFKLDSLKNVDDLKDKFKGVLSIAKDVKDGSADFDGLTKSLEKQGFTADQAKSYVSQLSLQYSNAELRQKAMTQAQAEGQDSLESWVDTAIKAIDVSSQLFNISDDNLGAMVSHVDMLETLQARYGKANAKNTDQWKDSIQALSVFTGVPDDVISKDLTYYHNVLELMGKLQVKRDKNGKVSGFDTEGLNKKQIAMAQQLVVLGQKHGIELDLITKKMYRVSDGVEMVMDKNGKYIAKVDIANKKTQEALKKTANDFDKIRNKKMYDEQDGSPDKVQQNNKKVVESNNKVVESVGKVKSSYQDMKLQKLYNENDNSSNTIGSKIKTVKDSINDYKQSVIKSKQEKLFNESDTSSNALQSKFAKANMTIEQHKQKVIESKQEKLFNENDQSSNALNSKFATANQTVEEYRQSVIKTRQEKLFNEADESSNAVKTKIDAVGQSADAVKQKIIYMKQQKLWDENTSGGDATKSKVDALTEAIKKATSGTQLLNNLNTMVGNSTTQVGDLLTKLRDVASGMDNMSGKANAINSVKDAIATMVGSLLLVQEKVGSLFNGINTSANNLATPIGVVRVLIEKIGISADLTKLRIADFALTMSGIGSLKIGGISELITQLGLLANNLAIASQYGTGVIGANNSIIASFSSVVNAVKSYSSSLDTAVSSTSSNMGKVVSIFSVTSTLVSGHMSTMASRMLSVFQDGINKIVNRASGIPKRVGDAIRSNMGYVVSAMKLLSNTVSNASIKPTVKLTKVGGYAKGGIVDKMELAWHGEEGAEAIIPLIAKRRQRGLELWKEAGKRLGIDTGLLDYMEERKKRKSSGGSAGESGSVGASSGEGGSAVSGGDSGSSGTMISSTPTFIDGGMNLDGGYDFYALATKKASTSKTSSKSSSKSTTPKENIAEAFSFNALERAVTAYQSAIDLLNISLDDMDKTSSKYRNGLKQLIALENNKLVTQRKDLAVTEKRQKEIEKQLKKLPAKNKQNSAQRDSYNKLMQEYDTNIGKVQGLKNDIASMMVEIKNKSLEMFNDSIDEIVVKYDNAIATIKKNIEGIDFKIQVNDLINVDDVGTKLNLLAEKANAQTKEKDSQNSKVANLQRELASALKKYGENSAQYKKVKEALAQAESDLNNAKLDILNTEKEIRDVRADVADAGIDELKNYYSKMKDMSTSAIDAEKEALQKAHDDKMKMYDDEIAKINSVYDNKIKSMDDAKSEEDYQTQLNEKNANKSTLVNKISLLSRDTSLEGKKKLAELQKELEDANKDISDFMKSRQDDLLKDQLQTQKDTQIREIEGGYDEYNNYVKGKREVDEKSHTDRMDALDAEKEAISKHYDDILNDEKYWADMRAEFIKGNFKTLQGEMTKMNDSIKLMNSGVFDSLAKDFKNYSDEVKKQVAELNAITLKNMTNSSSKSTDGVDQTSQTGYDVTNGTGGQQGLVTVEKPINLWKRNGDKLEFVKVLPKGSQYKVYGEDDEHGGQYNVGGGMWITKMKGYLSYKKFDTGGYTGEWSGSDGKFAMLHKKEQVFKEEDTKNLLDASKIMRTVSQFMPKLKRNMLANAFSEDGALNITNNYNLTVNIDNVNGNKEGANTVVKEIMKGLKKLGK